MNNDQLLSLWKAQDQKLDMLLANEQKKQQEAALKKAKRKFNRLTFEPYFEIALAIILMFFTGPFTAGVWGFWPLVWVSGLFHLFLITAIVMDVRLIYLVKSLKYDQPIAQIQQHIRRIRKAKIFEIRFILWGFVWLTGPFVMIFLYLLLGVENMTQIPANFWWTNGLICLLIALMAWHLSTGLSRPKTAVQKWFTSQLTYGGLQEMEGTWLALKEDNKSA